MDRDEIWARMAELDAKEELTDEEKQERYELWSLDWYLEEEDIRTSMYGY